jgi:dihydrofolate synthase/folylpolyglutamate synthase
VGLPEQSPALRAAERYLASLEVFGMRFGLDRMLRLMTALGSPQERFASIHVLGSNGKSSTARMIAALLDQTGAHTGSYLSPHLVSWAERIEVAGRPVTDERFAEAVARAAEAAAKVDRTLEPGDRVTQFEALTAAAYWELARAGVDVAVIEAGLGGRYDATSVIRADVQVLTNVSLEHTRWLGPTERHIAEEKLAVVPEGGTLVAGPLGPEAFSVAARVAQERGARLLQLGRDFGLRDDVRLRPRGMFQRENFAVALATAEAYAGRRLGTAAVRAAAETVTTPGRIDIVAEAPLTIRDGAHNPAGIAALLPELDALVGERPLVAVLSVLDDKDAAGMLSALVPRCARAVFTRSSHPSALPPAVLESLWRQVGGRNAEIATDPADALARARRAAGDGGAVLITGSIYLLSDLARAQARRAKPAG